MTDLIPAERIENKIYLIRGQKVMLDRDLAKLYQTGTRDLNKAVTRNIDRFPNDFMFQLSKEELNNLMFHFGTSNLKSQFATARWGGPRKLPKAFTEQGIAMLSSVLRSKRAIQVNIAIMRAFVKLRRVLATHNELTRKFKELELKVGKHDNEIQAIFEAIKKMITPTPQPPKRIGFRAGNSS